MEVQNIAKTLTCPVFLEPLTEAVTLIPCCHKVNETAAIYLYDIVENNKCSKSGNCPVCRSLVIAYYTDYSIRELAKNIFTTEEIKHEVVERCIIENKQIIVSKQGDLSYPGLRAKFVHKSGEWKFRDYGNGSMLCKELNFSSVTPNSLFEEFSLFGDKDGLLRMRIDYNKKKSEEIKQYLMSNEVAVESDYPYGNMRMQGINVKKMFSLIAKNNEIPGEYFQKLKDIIEIGRCVLTEEEKKLSQRFENVYSSPYGDYLPLFGPR